MLRYMTSGESHGPQLTAIVSGLPAGLPEPTGLAHGRWPPDPNCLAAKYFECDLFFSEKTS